MTIGWLALLKSVPWGDVASNAPKVADGAKKLWGAIARKSPTTVVPAGAEQAPISLREVQGKLMALEATTTELHEQLLASTELLKSLAEQNTLLIRRVDRLRLRMWWLTGLMVLVGGVAVAGVVLKAAG